MIKLLENGLEIFDLIAASVSALIIMAILTPIVLPILISSFALVILKNLFNGYRL
jgi:hypothetical protein